MADKKISELSELIQPVNNAVLPIVNQGVTRKVTYANLVNNLPIATFVQANSASWGGTLAGAAFAIDGNVGLFNTLNNTEYIVPWNTFSYQSDSAIIEADNVTNNIIIKQTGTYLINARYSSYDLAGSTDYLRIRLRGQLNVAITTVNGGSLLETLDEGFLTTGSDPVIDNGKASVVGTRILRVTQVPYYLVTTILHSGGAASGGTTAYPVFENSNGTLPYMIVQKLS